MTTNDVLWSVLNTLYGLDPDEANSFASILGDISVSWACGTPLADEDMLASV